jgi:SAM-dependent methyltransferase
MAEVAAKFQRLGPVGSVQALARTARVKLDMAVLQALRLLFGFERWHARSPDSSRPYRQQLAALVNGLSPTCVVEVGCGLGGILSRIKADRRHGYDRDPAVIRAARLLHGRSVQFSVGGFEQVGDRDVDVLIAVNWMHEFPPEQIERWILPLLPAVRYLLVDAINPGSEGGYRYYHDFHFLDGSAHQESVNALAEPNRRFILWKVSL